ncbi:hypothetical protein Barb6XT_03116 [Bacteroidales bacterium Barb6XT]|nr:hypothetical protein Barb6XT_03116 [Bacteroidales bacterium Barb6XT]
MKTVKQIEAAMSAAMKKQGTYTPEMNIQIGVASRLYFAFLKAGEAVEKLDDVCTTGISREGNERKVANPEFDVLAKMSEVVRKALRELHLTRDSIEAAAEAEKETEKDDTAELFKAMAKIDGQDREQSRTQLSLFPPS